MDLFRKPNRIQTINYSIAKNFMRTIFLFLLLNFCPILYSQTGINIKSTNPSVALDINTNNKGFLITRVPLISRSDTSTVSNPQIGMLVISSNTSNSTISDNNKVSQGILYKFNGEQWEEIIEEEIPSVGIISPEIVAYGIKNTQEALTPSIDTSTMDTVTGRYVLTQPNTSSIVAKIDSYTAQQLLSADTFTNYNLVDTSNNLKHRYNATTKKYYVNEASFNLNDLKVYRSGIQLHPNGSITADREGYYTYSISIDFEIKNTAETIANNQSVAHGNVTPGNVTYAFKNANDFVTHAKNSFSYGGTIYLQNNQTSEPFNWKLINTNTVLVLPQLYDKLGKQTVIWQYAGK